MRRMEKLLCADQKYKALIKNEEMTLNKSIWVDLDSIYGIEEVLMGTDGPCKDQCVIHYGSQSSTILLSPKQVKYLIQNPIIKK